MGPYLESSLPILRSVEVGSDWFVLLLCVAVFSKHGKFLLRLLHPQWSRISTCDFARAAALILLMARGLMDVFAISMVHHNAMLVDVGRIAANFLTALAVVPLFVSLERPDETTQPPEILGKLFRLMVVLYLGTLFMSIVIFVWFSG